jgi:hypothetical protein
VVPALWNIIPNSIPVVSTALVDFSRIASYVFHIRGGQIYGVGDDRQRLVHLLDEILGLFKVTL